ncbi:RICIN domain-containing protein [Streptomyces anandii]|uniref:RICIN domain-containing protein n=1 Tax=Streptomyces anandii TaxID=285454 RepID=UPI00379A84BF
MPTPHEYAEADESLAARLRGSPDGEAAQAVALLIARHWQAAHDYAVICLAASGPIPAMVTAAAFHQVLDRLALGQAGGALRPGLLVAVRDTARLWAAENTLCGVLPELRKPAGGRGMRTAGSTVAENRRLAQRSFESLPSEARCLLWHTEVEAEPPAVAAGLLGLDAETARLALGQARERFREGCISAHRELAPDDACRFHNRLLDAPVRRGGAALPEVRRHLDECRYCREAAEQLGRAETGLGLLLAEAVLGWGAHRYHDSRPARGRFGPRPRGTARHAGGRFDGGRGGGRGGGGYHWLPVRLLAHVGRVGGGAWSSRALRAGAGLVSAGLLVTVPGVSLWASGSDGSQAANASQDSRATGAGPAASAGTTGAQGNGTLPGPGSVPLAGPVMLRQAAAGLCLDVRGEPRPGAAARLAQCSGTWTQQWSLSGDGLLRSTADPGLCVDSHADAGVVILGACADAHANRARDVRYDLTAGGELLPRWDRTLALTSASPDPGADVVVGVRDGSTAQRWTGEPVPAAAVTRPARPVRPGSPGGPRP